MRNVPEGSRICVQTQVGRLGLEHCDPHNTDFKIFASEYPDGCGLVGLEQRNSQRSSDFDYYVVNFKCSYFLGGQVDRVPEYFCFLKYKTPVSK